MEDFREDPAEKILSSEKSPQKEGGISPLVEEPCYDEDCEWVVQPMAWGLVPDWSANPKGSGYTMINARSEGMLSKNSFKRPLERGRRCVVLVDG